MEMSLGLLPFGYHSLNYKVAEFNSSWKTCVLRIIDITSKLLSIYKALLSFTKLTHKNTKSNGPYPVKIKSYVTIADKTYNAEKRAD